MTMTTSRHDTPAQRIALVALFAALLAAFGMIPKIDLPLGVPITAQTMGVMLAGCLLGASMGMQAMLLFLLAVALGLPESLPANVPRQPLSGALRQYGRLLKDREYLGHALTGGIAPYNTYLSKDGHPITLGSLEPKFWTAFCAGAGIEKAGEKIQEVSK